jgi:short-subunit dehydrogenase
MLEKPTSAAEGGTMRQVTSDVWIVDDRPIRAAGVPIPIRMTIVRLTGGGLLLHSPTRYSDRLRAELERIGPIRYLLAPNIAHWMFLRDWQREVPRALTFAVPGLASRHQIQKAGVRIDREIDGETPAEWAGDLRTVLISAPIFREVELFDKRSRTLILADLVQNWDAAELPVWGRLAARLVGVDKPHGGAPVYLRLLLRLGGRAVKSAARRLVGMSPERVIFAHGDWFRTKGTEKLSRSLRWILPTPSAQGRRSRAVAGTRVVITGASSGIGRATALRFSEEGAKVVLAARRKDVLERLVSECEAIGGQAIAVPTDVSDADAVKALAARAVAGFGGIDVWINNAGTGVFGPFQEAEVELHRRTIEVNLLGTMHGASAALPLFLQQGRGILINNISIGGWAPTPFAAAYTASKFGLRGFTASLRQELVDYPHIHVCGVFPAMVDTPGFAHGANVSGKRLDPGPFLYQPEDVAEAFLTVVRRPQDEIAVGWPARAGQIAYALAPKPTEGLMAATFGWLLSRARPGERTLGTITQASPKGVSVDGGWLARKNLPPAGEITKIALLIGTAAVVLLAASRASGPRRVRRRRHLPREETSGPKPRSRRGMHDDMPLRSFP